MSNRVDLEGHFAREFSETGNPAWSGLAPSRLASVRFMRDHVIVSPLTGFVSREDAGSLQLQAVAKSRLLLRIAGHGTDVATHALENADERQIVVSHFLIVEYDSELRPIRAMDPWGYFRNNLGERMTHEFPTSRDVVGGVFADTSPQLAACGVDVGELVFDAAVMPEATSAHFKRYNVASIPNQTSLDWNKLFFHRRAMSRSNALADLGLELIGKRSVQSPGSFAAMSW